VIGELTEVKEDEVMSLALKVEEGIGI